MPTPRWGEVWDVDLGAPAGHAQGRRRPVIVISSDWFNQTRAGFVVAWPLSTKVRELGTHVRLDPPEGGVDAPSDVMLEHIRSLSLERLVGDGPRGTVADETMESVVKRLKVLLFLGHRA